MNKPGTERMFETRNPGPGHVQTHTRKRKPGTPITCDNTRHDLPGTNCSCPNGGPGTTRYEPGPTRNPQTEPRGNPREHGQGLQPARVRWGIKNTNGTTKAEPERAPGTSGRWSRTRTRNGPVRTRLNPEPIGHENRKRHGTKQHGTVHPWYNTQ